ncbi:MAG: VWA domain-containing protein [Acidobacteriaceae bacterium]|nr:VWA domain-containing protein [Acidobacteriaceae bacterium]
MLVIVVLPVIGLAIDGGVAYFAHARLTAAADAAALAGARSLNVGADLPSQIGNATSIAQQYFSANFPPGLMNSTNAGAMVNIPVPVQPTDPITVSVQASANVNLYFLGLLGHPTASITASAQTSRRDVNVVLTLDRSGSMSGVCGIMKSDAQNFVSMFVSGRDTVGLITFMGNATVDQTSTKNFKPVINNTLATLQCGGNTGSAQALSLAHQQILSVGEPGALNVIVFFTDGVPNGFGYPNTQILPNPAGFPVQSGKLCNGGKTVPGYIADGGGIYSATPQPINSTATPYVPFAGCTGSLSQLGSIFQFIPETDGYGNSASASGYAAVARDGQGNIVFSSANSDAVSINAADDAARQIRQDNIVIYTIGLDGDGGVDSKLLEKLANDPAYPATYVPSQPAGKYYYSPNAGQLGAAFSSIASEILRLSR